MIKKIFIQSKEEIFSVRDLSEFLYNIDNIHKLLVFEREGKEKAFYYRVKLPLKDALLIRRISKQSPFVLKYLRQLHMEIFYKCLLQY
jgi:hypothetical protein